MRKQGFDVIIINARLIKDGTIANARTFSSPVTEIDTSAWN